MASPVVVSRPPSDRTSLVGGHCGRSQALPPVSSYAFADILRAADGPDLQLAIDGIAEICAKNRMSLADEYSSHLPPLGEITAATSAAVRPQILRPGKRRALTSVPEASSSSSEGSHTKQKRMSGLFGFKRRPYEHVQSPRKIRIGSMGRTISISGTTAMAGSIDLRQDHISATKSATIDSQAQKASVQGARRPSDAASSLQRLLSQNRSTQAG